MNNSIQFALFFDEGIVYNPSLIATKIIEKNLEIGNPIILPINTETPKEANIPIIVFNQNQNFQIVANFNNIIITLKESYIDRLVEIVNNILNIFDKEKIPFIRVGYVPTIILDNDKKEDFNKRFLQQKELNSVTDYHFAWLKILKFNNVKINYWERSIVDSKKINGLLKIYDFNTDEDNKTKIDKKFIKDFLDFCNEIIKE